MKSKLGLALAKGLGRKKAPLAELPIGMPKKASTEDMAKLAEVSLAEESKRMAHEFKDEARRHLERVKALEAQLNETDGAEWCGGLGPGFTGDTDALCAPRETCEELCDGLEDCVSIDMHRTLSRS